MKIVGSIKFKLLFPALLAVFIITSIIAWTDVEDTKARLIAAQKDKALMLSDIIKQSVMILMIENKWGELQLMIQRLSMNNPELNEVSIFHPATGRIIVSVNGADAGKKIHEESRSRFLKGEEQPFIMKKGGSLFAARIVPINNLPACYRCHSSKQGVLGVLDVEVSLAAAQQSIKALTYKHIVCVIIGFIGIGIIFLIGGELLINAPLRRLTTVMRSVETGDHLGRANEHGNDEFSYLSSVFNSMIDSLEAARKEIDRCHQQQLERSAKLASLGEIISGIAHEIKNPLAGISCAVQVLRSELDFDESKKTVVNEILNQVNRLDKTVKDLLSYARPKTPQFLPAGITDVLEKALFFVYPEAKKQNITIETRLGKELPDIFMDADQLQQVFLNLIINAIQAMPQGGVLSISVSERDCHELDAETDKFTAAGKLLAVEFRDTGKGIAPEDLKSIFDPFFTKKSKGTGLGLSISQKIIRDHGGEIVAASEPGKGSVFTVYLRVKLNQGSGSKEG